MTMRHDSLQSHLAPWLEAAAPAHGLQLCVADCAIAIRSNNQALRDALAAYYHDFLCIDRRADITVTALEIDPPDLKFPFQPVTPEPGKTRVKDETAEFPDGRLLRKRLTDMQFAIGPAGNVAIGHCRQHLNQVINFINNRFIDWALHRQYLLCHAAGVARDGRGLLLAGLSGRGKSTLALHLLGHGLDFVSNDRLLVRGANGDVGMLGVPKFPRINPGTILHNPRLRPLLSPAEQARFAELSPEQLWEVEHKYDVNVSEYFGRGRFRLEATLIGALVLTWTHEGGETRVRPVRLAERADLIEAIRKRPGVHYYRTAWAAASDISDQRYVDVLAGLPVLEVHGGINFAAAAKAALALLQRPAPAPRA